MSTETLSRIFSGSDAAARRRRGLVLILGALVMLLVQQKVIKFYFTPLIVGLTYLAGAAISGRRGAFWAPGLVTTAWGISVLLTVHHVVSNPHDWAFNIAAAIGVAVALLLRFTVGIAAGVLGLAVSLGVVLLHNYAHPPSWIFHGITFALLLGIWGLWELRPARGAHGRKDETTTAVAGAQPRETTRDSEPSRV